MEEYLVEPKYEIDVKLIGSDTNTYNLIGIVRRALVAHGVAAVEVARVHGRGDGGRLPRAAEDVRPMGQRKVRRHVIR